MMKNRIIISLLLSMAALVTVSCSGNTDPEGDGLLLSLQADRTELVAGTDECVTFTVLNGEEDVTMSATVTCVSDNGTVEGNVFTPQEAGLYVFVASYEGKESEEVKVTVTEPVESRFQRHVCVMEFTGTWCAQCPEGAVTLNYLVSKAYAGKAFALAFHNEDEYALPQEQELMKIFKWSGYPAYVTDMMEDSVGSLTEGGCGASIDRSLYETQTHCGVAVESSYTEGKVTVDAKVFSEKSMDYRFAAYVIEDKVVGEQMLSTGTVQEDYVHRHVVRKMLSSNVRGDSLGEVKAEEETHKTYTFTVEEGWNIENLSVAVLAINEDGHVNNMAVCQADGGKMDYEFVN